MEQLLTDVRHGVRILAKSPGLSATAALLGIELLIAIFLNDPLIRPHVGDALAVILVYLGLRTVLPWRPLPAALPPGLVALIV